MQFSEQDPELRATVAKLFNHNMLGFSVIFFLLESRDSTMNLEEARAICEREGIQFFTLIRVLVELEEAHLITRQVEDDQVCLTNQGAAMAARLKDLLRAKKAILN